MDKQTQTVVLADGREVELRKPKAGELRGIKVLDLLQMDLGVVAVVLERVSSMSKLEFYGLDADDAMALTEGLLSFFQPTTDYPNA